MSGADSIGAERQAWTVRRLRLGEEAEDDLLARSTAEQRLEMVEALSLESWSLTGRPLPDYRRAETPVRKIVAPAAAALGP